MSGVRSRLTRRKIFACFLSCLALLALTLLPTITPATFAQGFDKGKMKVTLNFKQPPPIYPSAGTFSVTVTAAPGIQQDYAQRLKERIENSLSAYDRSLQNVATPELTITCTLSALYASAVPESRLRMVYQKTGEYTTEDPATNVITTTDIHGYVSETYSVTVLSGALGARYEILETATGRRLVTDAVQSGFHQEYESAAPGVDYVFESLLTDAALRVVAPFSPSFQPLVMTLPVKKLKRASELLQKQRWNTALAALNALPQFKTAQDEAFRLYAFGVAYEGLAGDAPDLLSTKLYLEQALGYFQRASQDNRAAPHFQNAVSQVERELQPYQRIADLLQAHEAARLKRRLDAAVEANRLYTAAPVLTNAEVVALARAGATEKELRKRVSRARGKVFDLSAKGVDDLSGAGVGASVIDDQRDSMRARPVAGRARRKWLGLVATYLLILYPYLLAR